MMFKFNSWKLRKKFTILLLVVLLVGLTCIGTALAAVLERNTENEVSEQALILMETMNSVRDYTSNQVQPELADRMDVEFLPETIPAYSAREVFETLRQNNPKYRDFFYKEATINPTNLRDSADKFETVLVEKFIGNSSLKETSGFRSIPGGDIFYIARPIRISKTSCLECHSTPDVAPRSFVERYGTVNGYGWKLNEIVGAQTISVPAQKVFNEAQKTFLLLMGIVSSIFIAVILLVNDLLNRNVIRPLKKIVKIAQEVSTGDMNAEFEQVSEDEIGNLTQAFQRMKLSLTLAMNRISQIRNINRDQ
jgi:HAMP domain-containing protein